MRKRFAASSLILLVLISGFAMANEFGHFVGRVVTEWLPDGRRMKLIEPFGYVSPTGAHWDAPMGSIIDGASIPRFAWAAIGGPFEGRYREASVIHDVACVDKNRPWQDVHRAFHTAMLANGVGAVKAKIMYGAVYFGGPRWQRMVSVKTGSGPGSFLKAQRELEAQTLKGELFSVAVSSTETMTAIYVPDDTELSKENFEKLSAAIEDRNLSLEEIEDFRF